MEPSKTKVGQPKRLKEPPVKHRLEEEEEEVR
jgi:hypothetical protein